VFFIPQKYTSKLPGKIVKEKILRGGVKVQKMLKYEEKRVIM
jgi:hypothetical protein